jgi:hypothetical protein
MQPGETVLDEVPGKGERVKHVPEVHDEYGDRDGGKWRCARDHADDQQLQRPSKR